MHIMMMGTGYVGLVTAATLAEMGHSVMCLDIDAHKIKRLQQGELPIYEPGLLELVERNTRAGRLLFTTVLVEAINHASVCFLALPTPSLPSGECDLSYIFNAARSLAEHITLPLLIVNKSTAPVGTVDAIEEIISQVLKERGLSIAVDVASNPEFLKEGAAVADCMKPDRIILGTKSEQAAKQLKEIYAPFTINRDRIFVMDTRSAEMTKYAANAMLALRISFMNELSVLCEEMGADIKEVRLGVGSDARIGHQFLYAGMGYGGSCFPKDIRALGALAQNREIPMPILNAIELTNERQKQRLGTKMETFFKAQGGLAGKTIALWGLSFKPDTDDIREAPSLTLIKQLLESGAHIRAYDPVSNEKVKALLPSSEQITFCSDEYEAATGADAIALVTEWKQFRSIDFRRILPLVNQRVFFDGRNQYDSADMRALDFTYFGIGVPYAAACPEVTCC
jgi:UDPglucose 6-dehydrogenase